MAQEDELAHTSEGIPIGGSYEEQKLNELRKEGKMPVHDEDRPGKVKQRTDEGYEEIDENEIPLSEQAGEGRAEPKEDDDATWHQATRQQTGVLGATSPRDETTR